MYSQTGNKKKKILRLNIFLNIILQTFKIYIYISIYFYQLEANYFTILQWFLPYIDMNQPSIYMCSPSRTPLPPLSPSHPSGSSQCTSPEPLSHASHLDWRSVSHLIIYMFRCCSLRSSHPRLLPQSPKVCSVHLLILISNMDLNPKFFCDLIKVTSMLLNLSLTITIMEQYPYNRIVKRYSFSLFQLKY